MKNNFFVVLVSSLLVSLPVLGGELITLKTGNFSTITGEITYENITKNITDVLTSDKEKPFYLYIDSPGGSVFGAFRLIEVLRNTKNVICVSNKAISAAYIITQACPVRDVLGLSSFMYHSVQSSAEGSTETINNNLVTMKQLQALGDDLVAKRLGISLEELVSRKIPEYWTSGAGNLIYSNQADNQVEITCDTELAKKTEEVEGPPGFLGHRESITRSACPL